MASNRDDDDNEGETWDIGGILFLMLLLMVLAGFCLGTHKGNEMICKEGYAPTFIDCAKVQ